MSLWRYRGVMRENDLSWFGKRLIIALLALFAVAAGVNIARRDVPHPATFVIAILGFSFFLLAKLSVIRQGRWISFGTDRMADTLSTMYRLGYWLMIVGLLLTFV